MILKINPNGYNNAGSDYYEPDWTPRQRNLLKAVNA